jgi:hypothetical protein
MEWGLEFQDNLNPVAAPIVHRVKIWYSIQRLLEQTQISLQIESNSIILVWTNCSANPQLSTSFFYPSDLR